MHGKQWVRVGAAVVVLGGGFGGMSAAGCAGDDNVAPTQDAAGPDRSIPGPETGTGDGSTNADGGTAEGSSEGSTPPPNAVVYLVHAAADPNAPPLRFCFGLGNPADGGAVSVASLAAFPDSRVSAQFPIAGLFPGFGGSTKSSPTLSSLPLATLGPISLYAINAETIASDTADGGPDGGAEIGCSGLIGTDALGIHGQGGGTLTMGTDYWYVGTFANSGADTLAPETTWIAAVTGCLPGEDVSEAAFCGATYNASTGNLSVVPWQLDSKTTVDAGIGVQFGNASPSWDAVVALEQGVATAAGFWTLVPPSTDGGGTDSGDENGDASSGPSPGPTLEFTPIASPAPFGSLNPATLVSVPLHYDETSGFGAAIVGADGGIVFAGATNPCTPGVDCFSPLLYPLPAIDQLSNPVVPDGGSFVSGQGYAFVLVGDPLDPPYINPADGGPATSTTGVFNGKSAHFLAFPTANQ